MYFTEITKTSETAHELIESYQGAQGGKNANIFRSNG